VGRGFRTMKWSKKTAQGFSPGSQYYGTRPERATERRIEVSCSPTPIPKARDQRRNGRKCFERLANNIANSDPFGRPFKAFPAWGPFPGLKPWAVL